MFAAPKMRKIADDKLEKPIDPFILTSEEQKQLEELRLTNEKLNKEKKELEMRLKQVKGQITTITNKLHKFAQKPDMELEELLKKKMSAIATSCYDGVRCHANLERKVIAIDLYPVEDLEAVKKVFHSLVDPKSMKISDRPLDGTSRLGGPVAYLEINMMQRVNLLKGLQLAQADLDIPMSRHVMKC